MSVKICGVEKGSIAAKKRIYAGYRLISINGNEICDFLDYQFYLTEPKLRLEIETLSGRKRTVKIKKDAYEDIGLDFDDFIMDKQRSCANKCIFCFIDQLPPGMRSTLYFKDDDARLSFLFGNYITLTNISEKEINRIIKMHISPINVSVHTMNKELRVKMMHNKRAGMVLDYLYILARAGIKLNAQLVLCPGINDGDELRYSIEKLTELLPSLQSIAAVPVGITKYREGLAKISSYTKEQAEEVIDIIEEYGDKLKKEYGNRIIYPADEFYLKAQRSMPAVDFYEDFPQIENGVGMWSLLKDEFKKALADSNFPNISKTLSIASGTSAALLIQELVDLLHSKYYNIKVNVIPVANRFFGETINVSGLVTGGDITEQLKGAELGEKLLIPYSMLKKDENIFLDDITLKQLANKLGVKVQPVENNGFKLLDAILGE